MVEAILPGTYISVRDEGLISAGSVSTGNIGIVGTAAKGAIDTIQLIGSFSEAKEIFGDSDPLSQENQSPLTLIRALELLYNNGGKTVYAVRTASKSRAKATYQIKDGTTALLKLEAKGSPGSWGNGIRIKITDIAPADDKDKTISKKIDLTYGAVQETYFFTPGTKSVADLQKTLNERSILVTAPEISSTSANKSPNNTDKVEPFSGGNDGADAGKDEYQSSLALLENDIINIVLLAGQDNSDWGGEVLEGHLKYTAGIKRERIGIIGSGLTDDDQKDDLDTIANHSLENDRLIFVAPGLKVTNRVNRKQQDKLSGGYTAAAIAGLLSSLPVQTSPTNKTLSLSGLSTEFNASQLEKLVSRQVLVVGKQEGYRVIKGITTNRGAWQQITTRRIVDYAIYGVRSGCNPYIGKLNNERVRGAMKATLDSFLTRMVNDEALVGYSIEVSATRAQEIAGKAMVTMTLQPTFSIDFVKVTMYLG
jgi:Phage tail sheath C-terminal domain